MGLMCSCPLGTALESIPTFSCVEHFGQIQKVAFQRIESSAGVKNFFDSAATPPNDIKLLASWTAAKSAADGKKVVISPYLQAPATDGGDAITFGGGNDTLGGKVIVTGSNPVNFTSVVRDAPQNVIKAMKKLMCEAAADNLGVYLINENGQIAAIKDTTVATRFYPIPVRGLFIGDKLLGGLDGTDTNAVNWSFRPNWSDDVVLIDPTNFNAVIDL